MLRLLAAITIGKITFFLSRVLKIGGGSAAPGLYALKIDPDLVAKQVKQIPQNVVITGTNGKTTTAKLLDHFLKSQKLKTIRNSTGSNLERGIASTLILCSHIKCGKLKSFDVGIWELDEFAFNSVVRKINPQVVIFLNVFRDQLDRYGEVDTVIKRWRESLKDLGSDTLVIVNGDDVNTASLASDFSGKVEYFGIKGHQFKSESAGKEKRVGDLSFEASEIKTNGLSGTSFRLAINHAPKHIINLPLPGVYHIYDFLAALAVSYHLNLSIEKILKSLESFSPAFGRVEKISFTPPGCKHEVEGFIFLIKNPAGATQVFETIEPQIESEDRILMVLNDNFADGKDVSWIWDADFEALLSPSSRAKRNDKINIVCSGGRAQDLAVRLKYAGFDPSNILVENNLEKALQQAKQGLKGRLFILPTYTALLELQRLLTKLGIKKHYWKEG